VTLRRFRAAFGLIEVLAVIDHHDDQDQATPQGDVADQEAASRPLPGP
jgi:inorganic pyrophosphatase/exopolyphosphatase